MCFLMASTMNLSRVSVLCLEGVGDAVVLLVLVEVNLLVAVPVATFPVVDFTVVDFTVVNFVVAFTVVTFTVVTVPVTSHGLISVFVFILNLDGRLGAIAGKAGVGQELLVDRRGFAPRGGGLGLDIGRLVLAQSCDAFSEASCSRHGNGQRQ